MCNFERFTETQLPPKDSFYKNLDEDGITDEQYLHAQSVFNQFNCRNLGDYYD